MKHLEIKNLTTVLLSFPGESSSPPVLQFCNLVSLKIVNIRVSPNRTLF